MQQKAIIPSMKGSLFFFPFPPGEKEPRPRAGLDVIQCPIQAIYLTQKNTRAVVAVTKRRPRGNQCENALAYLISCLPS